MGLDIRLTATTRERMRRVRAGPHQNISILVQTVTPCRLKSLMPSGRFAGLGAKKIIFSGVSQPSSSRAIVVIFVQPPIRRAVLRFCRRKD